MNDLERMRAVTENFFLWQGLRLVPLGVMGIFLALHMAEPSWWLHGAAEDAVFFTIVILGSVVFFWIGGYYHRNFGDVHGLPGRHQHRDTIKWWLVYPVMMLSLVVDGLWRPPVFVSGIVWAAAAVAFWASTGRGRRHYLVLAALLAAVAFLPTLGLVPAGKAMLSVFIGVLGAIYIVAGFLDHRELTQVLRPVREEG